MITRTRIYEYEPQALARDKRRRRAARVRSFIIRAFAVLLIAAAVYLAITSLTPAHGDTCAPGSAPGCQILAPALPFKQYAPAVMKGAR